MIARTRSCARYVRIINNHYIIVGPFSPRPVNCDMFETGAPLAIDSNTAVATKGPCLPSLSPGRTIIIQEVTHALSSHLRISGRQRLYYFICSSHCNPLVLLWLEPLPRVMLSAGNTSFKSSSIWAVRRAWCSGRARWAGYPNLKLFGPRCISILDNFCHRDLIYIERAYIYTPMLKHLFSWQFNEGN